MVIVSIISNNIKNLNSEILLNKISRVQQKSIFIVSFVSLVLIYFNPATNVKQIASHTNVLHACYFSVKELYFDGSRFKSLHPAWKCCLTKLW